MVSISIPSKWYVVARMSFGDTGLSRTSPPSRVVCPTIFPPGVPPPASLVLVPRQRGCEFVLRNRVGKQWSGTALQVVVEHGPRRLVDVDVGRYQFFAFELGLGVDAAVGGDDHRAAVLMTETCVAGGKPDRVFRRAGD